MTSSKSVRVRIRSPPASSTSINTSEQHSTSSIHASHRSRCSHCEHERRHSPAGRQLDASNSTILQDAPLHGSHYSPRMAPRPHPFSDPTSMPYLARPEMQVPMQSHTSMPMPMSMPMPIPMHMPHEPRLNPFAPAPVLHHLGRGPEPLFGWESVMPLNHTYGQPRYMRRTKPDYRRFCFSVGKADVPFAAMPGGPLWGMDVTMAPQMVGGHRW